MAEEKIVEVKTLRNEPRAGVLPVAMLTILFTACLAIIIFGVKYMAP